MSHELILLGNRYHLAVHRDLGDPDSLRDSIAQVVHTTGIGLAYLSQGELGSLAGHLRTYPLLLLFQIGNSIGLRLARRLRTLIKNPKSGLCDYGILRVDSPLREVLAGLLARQPKLYWGLIDPNRTDYRPFFALHEIAETARAVTEAGFRAALVGEAGLGITDAALGKAGFEDLSLAPPSSTLLTTLLMGPLLGAPMRVAPMDADGVSRIRARLLKNDSNDSSNEFCFSPEENERMMLAIDAAALHAFPMVGAMTKEEATARARRYGSDALAALVRELATISEEAADLRFMKTLWTREAYPFSATDGISDPQEKEGAAQPENSAGRSLQSDNDSSHDLT